MNVAKSCPDKLFPDTKVGVSQSNVKRLRRENIFLKSFRIQGGKSSFEKDIRGKDTVRDL